MPTRTRTLIACAAAAGRFHGQHHATTVALRPGRDSNHATAVAPRGISQNHTTAVAPRTQHRARCAPK
jgi:hypothetical protein